MKKIFTLFLALASVGFVISDLNSEKMKNINDFLKDQVKHHLTPSIQYAFFDSDSVIYAFRHGLKNVKSQEPVDDFTTYHLYSITKTFTALSVLQLAEAGKIELDKPVISYLPEFPYGNGITVEQLLNHTGGIPNPMPLNWIHLEEEHADFKRNEFFSAIFKKHNKLDLQPGSAFKYSNLGYVLLGQLVERVSDQSFEAYVNEKIVEPIGIDSTDLGFQINPDRHSVGYHKWWSLSHAALGFLFDKKKFMGNKEGKWKPFHRFYNNGISYGGMIGSKVGLIRYAQALMQDNSILLNNHWKQKLFTENLIQHQPTAMSLSWFTGSLKGNIYFAHAGGGGGYYTELRIYPELGVGSVILHNRSGLTDERALDRADRFFITQKAL